MKYVYLVYEHHIQPEWMFETPDESILVGVFSNREAAQNLVDEYKNIEHVLQMGEEYEYIINMVPVVDAYPSTLP